MQNYAIRRLLLFIPTLIAVSMLVFALMRVVPGDVAILILAGPGEEGATLFTDEEVQALREQLGLDNPIYVQYVDWMRGVITLDFGDSLFANSPVASDVLRRFYRVSLPLTFLTVILALLFAIPSGVAQAIMQDRPLDYILRAISIGGVAMPGFVVGTLMLLLTVRVFTWIPPLEFRPIWEDPLITLQQLIMPALALGYLFSASLSRMVRSTMLEVLRQDYIRTARAKGLNSSTVIVRHALRNALLPVVTLAGLQLGTLLGGTVIIETLFNLPGVGRATIQAINTRDYPLVQFVVLLFATIFLTVNLMIDLAYGVLDPRIRYG